MTNQSACATLPFVDIHLCDLAQAGDPPAAFAFLSQTMPDNRTDEGIGFAPARPPQPASDDNEEEEEEEEDEDEEEEEEGEDEDDDDEDEDEDEEDGDEDEDEDDTDDVDVENDENAPPGRR